MRVRTILLFWLLACTTSLNALADTTLVIVGDAQFCPGEGTMLTTQTAYASYLWGTGDTTSHLYVDVPGVYCITVTDDAGLSCSACISVVEIPVVTSVKYLEVCESDVVVCIPGCPTLDTLVSSLGCDSIVVLDLVVIPEPVTTLSQSICYGDSVLIGMSWHSVPGVYTITLGAGSGCDSIVMLDLSVDPWFDLIEIIPDDGLGSGAIHLTDSPANTSYLWSNGQTGASATGLSDGVFSVTVSSFNGCTAVETYVVPSGIPINPALGNTKPFGVHPNPSEGSITIDIPAWSQADAVVIMDITGRTVFERSVKGMRQIKTVLDQAPALYIATLLQGGKVISSSRVLVH